MGLPWRATPSWAVVDRAESALGRPLAHLLLDAGPEVLNRTQEAQLSVALASLVAWEATKDSIDEPVAFAGHSLGQVTALIAAGVLDLEDGVRLVWERARCTQEAADRAPGSMAAVMGLPVDTVAQAAAPAEGEAASCWVANDNAPGQVVIGGTPSGLESAIARARDLGARRIIPLKVGGAFHTPLMASAPEALAPAVDALILHRPSAPVLSNIDGAPHSDADGWRTGLLDQLVSLVRWRQSMERMATMRASTFLEVGPGNGVLAGLARRTVPHITVDRVSVPDDVAASRRRSDRLPSPLEVA